MTPVERFQLAMAAEAKLSSWSAGAQMLALVDALREKGWLRFLREPRSFDALASFSDLPVARVRDVVDVLAAHGVSEVSETVQLTAEFREFSSDDAFIGLDDAVDNALVLLRAVPQIDAPLTEPDALAIARAAGGRAGEIGATVYGLLLAQLDEIPAAISRGRWLDVGCGVAGATLSLASSHPEMRATAIELLPAVAKEAQRRAEELGVADRVDIRCQDAREFTERDAFAGAFWAQPFFPQDSRPGTLAMILGALEPGGELFMQEMEAAPEGDGLGAYLLRRLVYQGWGVPFGRPAEDLVGEAVTVGFELVRIASTDFGRCAVVRKPRETCS
ncbi:class I SAM-dependent methyltransferase [Lentzea sp. NPDC006480]|uniref:SAM-dependent methyltransferase n=1 Tax=Lentzea sp. NPDC006480 TaxID=3157176 RepID=UPI0033BC6899